MKRTISLATCLLTLAIPGSLLAAPRPDLYPNQHLNSVGPERARRDVNECTVSANDYLSSRGMSAGGNTGRAALGGAARGAALGALAGTIVGSKAGRGAGAGAAIGGLKGVGSAHRETKEGTPEYRQYVEACLEDRGYKVVGWQAG